MCLAAARIGETDTFDEGVRRLEAVADDEWARSNIAHVRGFSARLQGKLPMRRISFESRIGFRLGTFQRRGRSPQSAWHGAT